MCKKGEARKGGKEAVGLSELGVCWPGGSALDYHEGPAPFTCLVYVGVGQNILPNKHLSSNVCV